MFAKKFTVFLITLLMSVALVAQTKVIAFRSHSGNMNYFSSAEPDNLGEPPLELDSIVWVSDSTVMEYYSSGIGEKAVNTINNHPYCNDTTISYDSLKSIYPRVVLVGFDSTSQRHSSPAANSLKKNDKHTKKNQEQESSPILNPDDTHKPNQLTPFSYFIIGSIALLILIALFIWLTHRHRITTT